MRNLRSLAHFSESYLKSFLKSYWARPLVAAAAVIVMLIPIGVAAAAPPLPEAKPSGFKRIDRALKQEATPARRLFKRARTAAPVRAEVFGRYARGCLAGAEQLAMNGPGWQAMRLSRNRRWGHPNMIRLIQRLARDVTTKDGWPGLLVGDIAMPRGGPMWPSHASHQHGLDADIWLTPMPDRVFTRRERETTSATCMLKSCGASIKQLEVNENNFGDGQIRVLKRVASYPQVERILLHPTLKRFICTREKAAGRDTSWLSKVRPVWGHNYHFHIRMKCPPGSPSCTPQRPPPTVDGCGKEAEYWRKRVTARYTPLNCRAPENANSRACFCRIRANRGDPRCKRRKRQLLTMKDLPQACRRVLAFR